MALANGARLGPYEIVGAIGAGGMGEVYRARDTRLDRTVAIKVLPESLAADPQFRERFEREAKTISQLNHPHICTLHDVGEATLPSREPRAASDVPVHFLVMELVFWSEPGGLTSVALEPSASGVRVGIPKPLISAKIPTLLDARPHYDFTRDGERFLIRQPAGPSGSTASVIVNWPAKLKK